MVSRGCALMLLLAVLILFTSQVEGKKLNVMVLDENNHETREILEGRNFSVYVSDADDPFMNPLGDYVVEFNGRIYELKETDPDFPFCYITAPLVTSDQKMSLLVRKEGYEDAVVNITIKNVPKLLLFPQTFEIKPGESIEIEVRDENGKAVEGAKVELIIDGEKQVRFTNSSGMVVFTAPDVDRKTLAYIEASKEGYESTRIDGFITPPAGSFFDLFKDEQTFLIIGLALSMIFLFAGAVRYIRKREEFLEDYGTAEAKKEPNTQRDRRLEIEEIVIRKPEEGRRKETRAVDYYEKSRVKAGPDTWVIGRESVIEKIDEKLSGSKIKKKDITRWLTGKEDIASKVDEKIREIERRKKARTP